MSVSTTWLQARLEELGREVRALSARVDQATEGDPLLRSSAGLLAVTMLEHVAEDLARVGKRGQSVEQLHESLARLRRGTVEILREVAAADPKGIAVSPKLLDVAPEPDQVEVEGGHGAASDASVAPTSLIDSAASPAGGTAGAPEGTADPRRNPGVLRSGGPPYSKTYPAGVEDTYFASYEGLPAAVLVEFLGKVRDRVGELEDLDLQQPDRVLDAAILRLRDAGQSAGRGVEVAPDSGLDGAGTAHEKTSSRAGADVGPSASARTVEEPPTEPGEVASSPEPVPSVTGATYLGLPAEPIGLGAVVVDTDLTRWVAAPCRVDADPLEGGWWWNTDDEPIRWADLVAHNGPLTLITSGVNR